MSPKGSPISMQPVSRRKTRSKIANTLFRLRQGGLVASAGRGLYVRGTREKQARVPRPKRAAAAAPKVPAASSPATSEAILRKLVADTQSALDAYLAVGG